MGININEQGVLFCRQKAAEYLEQVEGYEKKAANCPPRQRGPYRSQAVQRGKDAQRMLANYDAQMGWLVEHNYPLYLKLKASEE